MIYIARHGDALPPSIDPQRGLSERGIEDVTRVAAFLRRAGVQVAEAHHSGKARAKQTAEILAKAFGDPALRTRDDVSADDNPHPFVEDMRTETRDLLVVGHLPFVAFAVGEMIGGRTPAILFDAGTVACLELVDSAHWGLSWLVSPMLLR